MYFRSNHPMPPSLLLSNLPGQKWNSISSFISARIHSPIWNGEREPKKRKYSIQQTWIADNGAALLKRLAQKESSSRPSITMDFAYGRVNIQRILFAKVSGGMEKEIS